MNNSDQLTINYGFITRPLRKIWNKVKNYRYLLSNFKADMHYKFFVMYINDINSLRAKVIRHYLPKGKNTGNSNVLELVVPQLWAIRLTQMFNEKSIMLKEVRGRSTTSDRLIQPVLMSTIARYDEKVWQNMSPEKKASMSEEQKKVQTISEDQYSQIVVQKRLKKFFFPDFRSRLGYLHMNDEVMEHVSTQIAEFIDKSLFMVNQDPKTEPAIESILTDQSVIDHESIGIQSVGGYIKNTTNFNEFGIADDLKYMLFHLPQGYRQRAKWYMHPDTALCFSVAKDGMDNYLIDQRDDALQTTGLPNKILSKPVVLVDHMPGPDNGGIVAILADLTRGYIMSPSKEFSLIIDFIEDAIAIKTFIGGQVLQPAAYKVYKYEDFSPEALVEINAAKKAYLQEAKDKVAAEVEERRKANELQKAQEAEALKGATNENSPLIESK